MFLKHGYGSGVRVWFWSMGTVLEYGYCSGVRVLFWSTGIVLEYGYGSGVRVWFWSTGIVLEHVTTGTTGMKPVGFKDDSLLLPYAVLLCVGRDFTEGTTMHLYVYLLMVYLAALSVALAA